MIRSALRHVFSKIKYPKLALLALTYLFAILIFSENDLLHYSEPLSSLGLTGVFVAGFFYAYEITAAPATAVLLLMAEGRNILVAGIVGGLGALVSDIIIFYFFRAEMLGEIRGISKTRVAQFIEKEETLLFGRFKKYVLYAFACFMVASPLPTEIGISILATVKSLTPKKFIFLAFLLHTTGILAILALGAGI